jgi:hypothetical protein
MIEKGVDGEFLRRAGGAPMIAGLAAYQEFRKPMAALMDARTTLDTDVDTLTQLIWVSLNGLASMLIARPEFPWVNHEALINAQPNSLATGIQKS